MRAALITDLPILAITAGALTETREQTRVAGCDGFICKPFTMLELFTAVDALTGMAKALARSC
jgi:DNA-binding response OmpR family regulator